MMQLTCPLCGPRAENEFHCGGTTGIARPPLDGSDETWLRGHGFSVERLRCQHAMERRRKLTRFPAAFFGMELQEPDLTFGELHVGPFGTDFDAEGCADRLERATWENELHRFFEVAVPQRNLPVAAVENDLIGCRCRDA